MAAEDGTEKSPQGRRRRRSSGGSDSDTGGLMLSQGRMIRIWVAFAVFCVVVKVVFRKIDETFPAERPAEAASEEVEEEYDCEAVMRARLARLDEVCARLERDPAFNNSLPSAREGGDDFGVPTKAFM